MTTKWAALRAKAPWINFKYIFYPGRSMKIVPKIVVVIFLTMLNIYCASFLQQIQDLAKQFCHQGSALPRHPQINVNIMIKKCWIFLFLVKFFCFGEVFARRASLYGSSFGFKQIDFKTLNSFRIIAKRIQGIYQSNSFTNVTSCKTFCYYYYY